ncbi:MAG: PLP-dependent cysteine synthase family protein [Deltaproteobacteria bacterium]|nr:PLP-dependent cysteine synthase family protein [Deltaproteobacteria bacterium]MCB9787178.1 PLP-dependent cysteine synthase family protein [Deltaproteobacteria bacterium]
MKELQRRYSERFPALGLVGDTPLVRIDLLRAECPDVEVHAKVESFNPGGSLKDRPVLYMLLQALEDGRLDASRTIIDSSSGNAGIAYAWIGNVLGLSVKLVIPDNASAERKKRMIAHGAQIHYTSAQDGYDEALREVRRLAHAEPDRYFFCDQYGNEYNWRAHYESTAEEIWAQTGGRVTHFVAGVGTGGTITGVGKRLKELNPKVQVHCVVPDAFPGVEGLKPLKDPEDIVPAILDQTVIDRMWDSDVDASWAMSQRLARAGVFGGQSSGAYMAGVRDLARAHQQAVRDGRADGPAVIVTMVNDIGERYMSTRLWDQ